MSTISATLWAEIEKKIEEEEENKTKENSDQ